MVYPPNNSSAPSPDSTTLTCLRASLAMKNNGTRAGSATGSSRYQTIRSEEHTSELQSQSNLVCRLLLEKKKNCLQLPQLLCGAVINAPIFAWPGLGALALNALTRRDYPVILGVALLDRFAVVVSSVIAD